MRKEENPHCLKFEKGTIENKGVHTDKLISIELLKLSKKSIIGL